jgi:beta-1,4-mannosyl-glycoprotein beta-1,4-N-acetylglucosaminyltransferase
MIHDCFTFFNELDLLEIRLRELDAVVDRFVLVEATLTHQGKPKPLHFAENKVRYAEWLHKIHHVVVEHYPPRPDGDGWVFEKYQRNSILDGLKDIAPTDHVMISDVDEIPRPDKVRAAASKRGLRIFRQRMYYYYLNCVNATQQGGDDYRWNGTVMIDGAMLQRKPQHYRELAMLLQNTFAPPVIRALYYSLKLRWRLLREGITVTYIDEGGWHFSYLGGVDRIVSKLEAFAHAEYNKPEFKDPERIRRAIEQGEDIFGRGFRYRFVAMDASWPAAIMSDPQRYTQLFSEAPKR